MGYLVATGSISVNLILNPSVETGETGPDYWVSSGNGTFWSTNYARTGSRSLRIDVVNASAKWESKTTAITEGTSYQILGFFTGKVTAGNFSLSVEWFSDAKVLIIEDKIPIPVGSSTQWLQIGNAFTAPSGAKSCSIVLEAVNGTGDLYGDDFEVRQTESLPKFFNSISIALIVYIVSYYIVKRIFSPKVEKPQKIATAGIGIYFLSWLVSWILLYTILATA
jgi:hypothetical protein